VLLAVGAWSGAPGALLDALEVAESDSAPEPFARGLPVAVLEPVAEAAFSAVATALSDALGEPVDELDAEEVLVGVLVDSAAAASLVPLLSALALLVDVVKASPVAVLEPVAEAALDAAAPLDAIALAVPVALGEPVDELAAEELLVGVLVDIAVAALALAVDVVIRPVAVLEPVAEAAIPDALGAPVEEPDAEEVLVGVLVAVAAAPPPLPLLLALALCEPVAVMLPAALLLPDPEGDAVAEAVCVCVSPCSLRGAKTGWRGGVPCAPAPRSR
jgi:hypothetical protein